MTTLMYLPMNCSVYQRPFVVAAEIRGTGLRLLQNYQLPLGAGSSAQLPHHFTAAWSDAAPSWRGCPYCGGYDSRRLGGTWLFWACPTCKARGNPGLNCAGRDSAGRWQCACGLVVTKFSDTPAPSLVRGTVGSAQQVAVETVEITYVAVQWRG
jgi:hypothetical protein